MAKPKLIVIVGPTAVGKTAISVKLAQELSCEIISADSRQFYHEMKIGTATPSDKELEAVPHHFVGSHSIQNEINAGDFEALVLDKLDQLYENSDVAMMVGGSGLYVDAVLHGFDEMPSVDKRIRENLNRQFQEGGLDSLLAELKMKDPEYFEQVDRKNPVRIIRALEVFRSSGEKYSELRSRKTPASRPFDFMKLGIKLDRDLLYQRIDERVDKMMEEGLLQEVSGLQHMRSSKVMATVGYQELVRHLEGAISLLDAVELIKKNSRNYAKRQMTWFRKDPEIHWSEASDLESIRRIVFDWLNA